jgi:hypothetical protein
LLDIAVQFSSIQISSRIPNEKILTQTLRGTFVANRSMM